MQIVIKLSDKIYDTILDDEMPTNEQMKVIVQRIYEGTPLPKGHGGLIDKKLVLSDDGLCEFHMYDDYVKMRNYLKSIPTIIEADKAESEVEE